MQGCKIKLTMNEAFIDETCFFLDGFPADFSILTTFRTARANKRRAKSTLFSIYSAEGNEVFTMKIARRLRLTYQGRSSDKKHRVKFGAKLADAKWHRLAISVKGNSITAIADCKKQQTRAIDRGSDDAIR